MLLALIGSLTVALISSAVAWRLYRRDELRSEARAAALAAAIGNDATGADEFAWETPPAPSTDAPGLFNHAVPSNRFSVPVLTAATTVAAGILVVVLMAMLADGERPTPTVVAQPPEALELLSMSHVREGSALVVTGLVRNASRATTAPLTTVLTALDADGDIIGSSSAALTGVPPGDTLAFTVRLEGLSVVGRYRVSFRSNSGVMPHVDRRRTSVSARVAAE
jgi:hypothetical protein